MLPTFEDYQAKYEISYLAEELNKRLNDMRGKVHRIVIFVENAYQGPDVIVKIVQLGVAIFSCFSTFDIYLDVPKQFCKEAKNVSNFVKGLKSIEGIFNFQFYWKIVILSLSGTTLFILSSLTLLDRFRLLNVTMIKEYLATIPVLGVLPYGGLLPLSMIGLMSILILFSWEKGKKMARQIDKFKNGKLVFWQQPLELPQIQNRQVKYETKVSELKEKVAFCTELLQEGERVEEELSERLDQTFKLRACQKAIQEIHSIQANKQITLDKYEKKYSQWTALAREWKHVTSQELENFRQAKESKWLIKVNKIERERVMNWLSILNNITVISKQMFPLGAVVLGYGLMDLPFFLKTYLDIVGSSCGIVNFFAKRAIRKIIVPTVDPAQYISSLV